MVPLSSPLPHNAAHAASRAVASKLAASQKDRYTVSANLAARVGRLFIDYLRNGRGTTAVGTWSPRARGGSPIAVPVTWTDVENGIRPDTFHLAAPPVVRRAQPTTRRRPKR
jgi:bifunctional non-homologous end joining protein LigD